MNKFMVIFLFLTIGLFSCKTSKKEINKVEIARQYFECLDNSDYSGISNWMADSLTTIEGAYEQTYSKSEYLKFLKWDAVFLPEYEIIDIEQKDRIVKARISKMDKRIAFLHEEPFITKQILKFHNEKIISVETEYVDFKEEIWEKNKNELLSWIEENHPELNGFLYDQTEAGGTNFLKAIKLYTNKE